MPENARDVSQQFACFGATATKRSDSNGALRSSGKNARISRHERILLLGDTLLGLPEVATFNLSHVPQHNTCLIIQLYNTTQASTYYSEFGSHVITMH